MIDGRLLKSIKYSIQTSRTPAHSVMAKIIRDKFTTRFRYKDLGDLTPSIQLYTNALINFNMFSHMINYKQIQAVMVANLIMLETILIFRLS